MSPIALRTKASKCGTLPRVHPCPPPKSRAKYGASHGAQSPHRQVPQARSSAVGKMVSSGGGVPLERASKTSIEECYSFLYLVVEMSCRLPPACGTNIQYSMHGPQRDRLIVYDEQVIAHLNLRSASWRHHSLHIRHAPRLPFLQCSRFRDRFGIAKWPATSHVPPEQSRATAVFRQ